MSTGIFGVAPSATADDARPTMTIVGRDRSRLFEPGEPTRDTEPASVKPQPGDSVEPNNYIPLTETNPFLCASSLTLGTKKQQLVEILPLHVSLTALASTHHLIYDLRISFKNHLGDTASALLSLPRLPNLLILEEEHICDGVRYDPRVEEKERADATFREAAASATHTATLSQTGNDAHHVRLDKVSAGAEATFGVKFIQSGGLILRQEVEGSSTTATNDAKKQEKRSIADLAILPGYTALDCPDGGVPFDFELQLVGGRLQVELPEENVLREELKSMTDHKKGALCVRGADILSMVRFAPALVDRQIRGDGSKPSNSLKWKSIKGLARGTLLKVRIVHKMRDDLVDEIGKLTLQAPTGSAPAFLPMLETGQPTAGENFFKCIDTIEGVVHDIASGTKCDSTLLDLTLPYALPEDLAQPSPQRHEIYVIIDTSGSTCMCTGAPGPTGRNKTFLDTSKVLIDGILRELPGQIMALRQKRAINDLPINIRLWSFNSNTTIETEACLWHVSTKDDLGAVEPFRAKVRTLVSSGFTNYDSWAAKLREAVGANPTNLHSVLLSTDGGATNATHFFAAISDIGSLVCNGGFFQVDSLGYGPWLDAKCVSYLAEQTGGEALMVESLEGKGVEEKVLSILTRSLVRAASQLSLTVENGKLLAVALAGTDAGGPAPEAEGANASIVKVNPGQSLRLVVLHPSGMKPRLRLDAGGNAAGTRRFFIPWPHMLPSAQGELGGWEMVSNDNGGGNTPQIGPRAAPASDLLIPKLAQPNTLRALRHLAVLEPAYSPLGSVHYPPVTAHDRTNVTLRTSLLGQLVAPSVTKGVAVVSLATELEPVPEHCRPKPSNLKDKYSHRRLAFEDERQEQEQTWQAHRPTRPGCYMASTPFLYNGAARAAPLLAQGSADTPAASFGAPAQSGRFRPPGAMPQSSPFATNCFPSGGKAPQAPPPPHGPGFKVTKQQNTSAWAPGLAQWIEWTRGGIFPPEVSQSGGKGEAVVRLTKSSIKSVLKPAFQRANAPKSAFEFSGEERVSKESVILRTIEGAVMLDPSSSGQYGEFEKWATLHKSDVDMLTSVLGFVAASYGVVLDASGSRLNLTSYSQWPWLVPKVEADRNIAKVEINDFKPAKFVGRKAEVPSNEELASRKAQESMFTPAIRRDIYRIMLNPDKPDQGSTCSPVEPGAVPFGAALVGKASLGNSADPDTFAFVDQTVAKNGSLPPGYSVLDEATLVDAIGHIGSTTPAALAVTLAFEDFLSSKVDGWTDKEVSVLSVEFLTAFGREMTPRLDVHHRIRSRQLTAEEIDTLGHEPFCRFVNQETLKAFQTCKVGQTS